MCPAAEPGVVAGDANGDGFRDLADVVHVREHVTADGPAPWCADAIDLVPDGLVELDDAFSLLIAQNEGAFGLPARSELACAGEPAAPNGPCRAVSLAIDPAADGAVVRLVAPGAPVQGWQLAVSVEGCAVRSATTDGTAGASSDADPPGARRTGYDGTFAADDVVTSTVLLSLATDATLETGPDGAPILALALAPDGGCGTCTVVVGDPRAVLGAKLDPVVVAGGARYAPPLVRRDVEVCTAR